METISVMYRNFFHVFIIIIPNLVENITAVLENISGHILPEGEITKGKLTD